MYRKNQILDQLDCTRSEFENILRKLQMEHKKDFSDADVKKIKQKIESKRKNEKLYIYITILVALVLVAMVFILFNIAVGKLGTSWMKNK